MRKLTNQEVSIPWEVEWQELIVSRHVDLIRKAENHASDACAKVLQKATHSSYTSENARRKESIASPY